MILRKMIRRLTCIYPKVLVCLAALAILPAALPAQEESTEDLFPDIDVVEEDDEFESTEEGELADVPLGGGDPNKPMTIEEAIQLGGRLLTEGQPADAVQIFSQVLNQPRGQSNVQALAGRGKAFADLKYFDLALKSFDKALQRSPNNPFALSERGKIFMEMENFREAMDDFERAVENFPTNPEFLKNYGKALIRFGQQESQLGNLEAGANIARGVTALGTAIGRLEMMLNNEEFPEERRDFVKTELAESYFERGLGAQSLRDFEPALADLEAAHELAPDNLQYAEKIGNAYFDTGVRDSFLKPDDTETVISGLTRAISRISETIERAEAKEREDQEKAEMGEVEESVRPDDEEVPFDPNTILGMYLRVARSRIELAKQFPVGEREEHYHAALEACQSALDRDDQLPEGYLYRGVAYRLLDEYKKAIDDFGETIRLGSQSSGEAVFRRGIAWYYLDEFELALKDFDVVGSDPRAMFWTGVIQLKNEEYTEAIDSFSESISLNGRYLLSYINRGIAHLKVGDFKRALRDFNEVIRRDPRNAKGYYLRGVAFEMTNSPEKAKRSFGQAAELDES